MSNAKQGILLLTGLAYLLQFALALGHLRVNRGSFGWEYGHIAHNLVLGQGFSGPFGLSETPTSWMPPILPGLISLVFLVFGRQTLTSAVVLLALQLVCLLIGLWALLSCLENDRERYVLAVLFWLFSQTDRYNFFSEFHDVGLLVMLSSLCLLSFSYLRKRKYGLAGALSFLLPLISPALSLSYVMALCFALREREKFLSVFWLS